MADTKIQAVRDLLLDAGFPPERINMFVAQVLFETGGNPFGSNVAKTNNNLSGIIFLNKPYQKNATRGLPKPGGEIAGYYANFKTPLDWAIDYKRVLSLNFGQGRPIDAPDVDTFTARLHANHYYEGNLVAYTAGVKKFYSTLASLLVPVTFFLSLTIGSALHGGTHGTNAGRYLPQSEVHCSWAVTSTNAHANEA